MFMAATIRPRRILSSLSHSWLPLHCGHLALARQPIAGAFLLALSGFEQHREYLVCRIYEPTVQHHLLIRANQTLSYNWMWSSLRREDDMNVDAHIACKDNLAYLLLSVVRQMGGRNRI